MNGKKCECEVCTCNPRRLVDWVDSEDTIRTGRAIKLAVKDYFKDRESEKDYNPKNKKDVVDSFYYSYCIGRFKMNDKSSYKIITDKKEDRLIPIKIKEKKEPKEKQWVKALNRLSVPMEESAEMD